MAQHNYSMMDIEDYLLLDRNSKHARYEYIDGDLRMLAGGSPYRSAIIANIIATIARFLDDSPCWIYNSDDDCNLYRRRRFMLLLPTASIRCSAVSICA